MPLRLVHGWRGLHPGDRGASLALGSFDGVHRGHREVIALAAKAAGRLSAPLGVVRFEPHPRRWLGLEPEPFKLMTLDQHARALSDLGVDIYYILPFAEIAGLSDEAFAREVLAEGLGVRHVAAGFDLAFGHDRTGGPQTLTAYGERFGFGVSIAPAVVGDQGAKYSSTAIRAAVRAGLPERAAELLGRPFAIEGEVVHGDHLGRTLGFPTANVRLGDYARPAYGIYASRTRLPDGREIPSVSYIGRRPTVDGVEELLEVHLLDFDEDLYGQILETDIIAFLRGDEKFDGLESLKAQMVRDCAHARARLGLRR